MIAAFIGMPMTKMFLGNTVENLSIDKSLTFFLICGGIIGYILFLAGLLFPVRRFDKVYHDFKFLKITEEKWNGYVDKLLAKLKGMGEVKAMLILGRHTHFREADYEKLNPVLNEILNRFPNNASLRGTAYAILAEGAFAENDWKI